MDEMAMDTLRSVLERYAANRNLSWLQGCWSMSSFVQRLTCLLSFLMLLLSRQQAQAHTGLSCDELGSKLEVGAGRWDTPSRLHTQAMSMQPMIALAYNCRACPHGSMSWCLVAVPFSCRSFPPP